MRVRLNELWKQIIQGLYEMMNYYYSFESVIDNFVTSWVDDARLCYLSWILVKWNWICIMLQLDDWWYDYLHRFHEHINESSTNDLIFDLNLKWYCV
jgi:hypothetical protein